MEDVVTKDLFKKNSEPKRSMLNKEIIQKENKKIRNQITATSQLLKTLENNVNNNKDVSNSKSQIEEAKLKLKDLEIQLNESNIRLKNEENGNSPVNSPINSPGRSLKLN